MFVILWNLNVIIVTEYSHNAFFISGAKSKNILWGYVAF